MSGQAMIPFVGSLRLRSLLLCMLVFLPMLALALLYGARLREQEATNAKRDALRLAQLAADDQNELIKFGRVLLTVLAQAPQVRFGDVAECDRFLAAVSAQFTDCTSLSVVAPNGDLGCSSEPLTESILIGLRPFFQRVSQTHEFVVGGYAIGQPGNRATVRMALPLLTEAGRTQAILTAELDLAGVNKFAESMDLPAGSILTVLDPGGTVLARYPEGEKYVGRRFLESQIVDVIMKTQSEGTAQASGIDGVDRLYAFVPLKTGVQTAGFLAVGIPNAVVFSKADRVTRMILLGVFAMTALSLALVWVGGDILLLRGIRAIISATKQLGSGDLSARTGLKHDAGELGELAHSFDEMAECLERGERDRNQSEEEYRTILHTAMDGFCVTDLQGRLLDVNDAYCRLVGYSREELLGMRIQDLEAAASSGGTGQQILRLLQHGFHRFETRHHRKDGTTVDIEISANYPLTERKRLFVFARDLSEFRRQEAEKEKLREQVIQAQKTESLGTLAGGIAHDFNNILGIISGYAELASLDAAAGSKPGLHLEQVIRAVKRGKALTSQILSFSRQDKQERKPIDVALVIEQTTKLLRASIPTTIEILQDLQGGAGLILADPIQMDQVIMNLCTNARQAMEERGGVLEFKLGNRTIGPGDLRIYPELSPGRHLELTVSDTGCGMGKDTLERMFDPYFTTKAAGEGTGLGLSVVHGIVSSHGGAIRAYSEPGKGTTFRVLLPCIEGEIVSAQEDRRPFLVSRPACILFVDDEAGLVDYGKEMLAHFGHEVTARTSSKEALEVFKEQSDKFDLVITDMTMPNMTGVDLSREMLRIRPDIPIIICTGFSERISPEKARAIGIREVLMKPVLARDLNDAIRRVLEEPDK